MHIGIIGLPQSGKTTIFKLLTRSVQPVVTRAGRFEIHTAVVDVPDPRLDQLSAHFKPEKTVYAKLTCADIAGLGGGTGVEIAGELLNQLGQMDGFIHVVRCFEDDLAPHPSGSVDPQRDIQVMDGELLLNDLIAIERKLERLSEERSKGGGREKTQIEHEINLFQRMQSFLAGENPLRDMELSPDEERVLAGYGFLTRKPVSVLLNLGDGQSPPGIKYSHSHCAVASLQGKLEMEIAQLPHAEAQLFLDEYGITEPGLDKVIRCSYQMLDRISFFTIGDDEVRAWTVRYGTPALRAAGAIHTDLQKGFIRAEVIPWDELLSLGSLAQARSQGKLRLEGKEYVINDGEVMHVRFAV
jgi:GTP-binding protein YchF